MTGWMLSLNQHSPFAVMTAFVATRKHKAKTISKRRFIFLSSLSVIEDAKRREKKKKCDDKKWSLLKPVVRRRGWRNLPRLLKHNAFISLPLCNKLHNFHHISSWDENTIIIIPFLYIFILNINCSVYLRRMLLMFFLVGSFLSAVSCFFFFFLLSFSVLIFEEKYKNEKNKQITQRREKLN